MAPKRYGVREKTKVSSKVAKAFGTPVTFDESPSDKRRIFIGADNVIMGIHSDNTSTLQSALLKETKRLTRKGMPPATHLLMFNLNPTMEHCDIVQICSRFAYPVSVNYFPGAYGKAWLKFEDQTSALKVLNGLRGQKVWGNIIALGLVEKQRKFVSIDRNYLDYNRIKLDKYRPKPVSRWQIQDLRRKIKGIKKQKKQLIKSHEGAKIKAARLQGALKRKIDSKQRRIAAMVEPMKRKQKKFNKKLAEKESKEKEEKKKNVKKKKEKKEKGKKEEKAANKGLEESLKVSNGNSVSKKLGKNARKKLLRSQRKQH